MPRRAILPARGLWTTPPGHFAPDGALAVADEVVIRRDGIVEPRLGWQQLSNSPASGSERVRSFWAFAGRLYVNSNETTNWTLKYSDDGGVNWVTVTKADVPPVPTRHERRHANLRDTHYFTRSTGGLGRNDTADNQARIAGMPRAGIWAEINSSSAGENWFADLQYVAYRVVLRRDYASGLTVRGAPSGRYVLRNTGGGARAASVTALLPALHADENNGAGSVQTGDIVELYRSNQAALNPDDVLQLVATHSITSGEVTAGSVSIEDFCADGARGANLYTNAAEEGVEGENRRPPIASEIAAWNGRLWAAGAALPHRLLLEIMSAGNNTPGYGYTPFGATVTVNTGPGPGTPQITGVAAADIAKTKVGMLVNVVGTAPGANSATIKGNSRVTAVGASTITLDLDPAAGGAGISVYVSDVVTVDGATLVAYTNESTSGSTLYHFFGDWSVSTGRRTMVQSLAQRIVTATGRDIIGAVTSDTALEGSLFLERTTVGGSFTFTTTHPDIWSMTPASGVADAEDRMDAIYYSKPAEPEHFAAATMASPLFVGDAKLRTLRMVGVGTVLYVFREDGVWRIQDNGGTPTVEPATQALHLLQPEAIDAWTDGAADVAYAWCAEGVHTVTDQGIDLAIPESSYSLISGPIAETLRNPTANLHRNQSTQRGAWLAVHPSERQVWLGVPNNNTDGYATTTFVYGLDAQAWTRTVDYLMFPTKYNPYDSTLWFGKGDSADVYKQRRRYNSAADWENYDLLNTARTIDSIVGTLVTFDSVHLLSVGDALAKTEGGPVWIVSEVVAANQVRVDDATGLTTGAVRQLIGYDCIVEWAPVRTPAVHRLKHWRDAALHWESAEGVYGYTVGFSNEYNSTPTASALTQTRVATATPRSRAVMVPASRAASMQISPRVTIHQAASPWRLAGLEIDFEEVGGRVRAG